jgi:hypothetical protein
MSEGKLGQKLKAKILENQGKVSFAFGVVPIIDEAKAELPTYGNILSFHHKVCPHWSMDETYISIMVEWAWKWLGVNIFTFDKRGIKPEIQRWFDEKWFALENISKTEGKQ